MAKISVIVPVYNVESYIKRCIESILNQSFKDIELILINDGSTDNSLKILNQYKSNKRVKIIDQKNKGAAKTRNIGIDKASSEYVMFIDSDDYIDDNYFKNFYESLKEDDYDLVIGGYKRIVNGKLEYVRKLKNAEFSKYIVMGPCTKLYKKSFLIDNNILFLDTTASEDVYFNMLAYSKNPKIKIINDVGYNYIYNPVSLSNTIHKGFNKKVNIREFASELNFKDIKNRELNEYYIIRYLIWYLLYSGKSATKKDFLKETNNVFNWLEKNITDYENNKYLKKMPDGEVYKIYFIIRTFMVIKKFKLLNLFTKIYCKGKK